jgi:methylated-DNA-[protein]-cysteine S-methyltransferase
VLPVTRKPTVGLSLAVFPSALGWMALLGRGNAVCRLVFGYPAPEEAVAALGDVALGAAHVTCFSSRLVARLKAYARRGGDDFRDVPVDPGPRTDFQRRVIEACRRIPCGGTSSYGKLAAAAGYPRAARAVGSVMATNQVPLIIPCHRVLASGGRLGGYSSRDGLSMKSRLLALEAARQKRPAVARRRPTATPTR